MKDRSEDPSHHERTLLPRSYISLLGKNKAPMKDLPVQQITNARYQGDLYDVIRFNCVT